MLNRYFAALCGLPQEQRLDAFYSNRIDPDWLSPVDRKDWDKMADYVAKHASLDAATVLQVFYPTLQALPTDIQPVSFCRQKLYDRHVVETLKQAVTDANGLIADDKELEALAHVKSMLLPLGHLADDDFFDFAEHGLEKFRESYKDKQTGPSGDDRFDFGWEWFDDTAHGVTGGDVVTVAGRPGAGKSTILLHIANANWMRGRSVLFFSAEMPADQIGSRLIGLNTGINPAYIDTGKLTSQPAGYGQVQHIETTLAEFQSKSRFWIMDGSFTAELADVIGYCTFLKPDVAVVDAAYLLKLAGSSRMRPWEVIEHVLVGLKRDVATRLGIPLLASFQLNRDASKDSNIGTEGIAGSDAIGRLSSVVMYVGNEKNKQTDLRRRLRVVKNRNGPPGEFDIWFDYDSMTFDQAPPSEEYDFGESA